MAEENHTLSPPPPAPVRTERWTLPSIITIENDGVSPQNTKLIDTETGEVLKLPVHALQLTVQEHQPPSVVIELGRVAIRSTVHHVHFEISEEDLYALAKMNGYRIEAVPAYPARMTSYGPLEHKITFRDFPDIEIVGENGKKRESIEKSENELALAVAAAGIAIEGQGFLEASELADGEFLVWAHPAP